MRAFLAFVLSLASFSDPRAAVAPPQLGTSPSALAVQFDCDPATVKGKLEAVRDNFGMSLEETFIFGGESPACVFLADIPKGAYSQLALIMLNCSEPFCHGFMRLRKREGEWGKGSYPFVIARTGAKFLFYPTRDLPDFIQDPPPGAEGGQVRFAWSVNEHVYMPVVSEEAAAASAARTDGAMTFRRIPGPPECVGCSWIVADGAIIGRTAIEFRLFLDEHRVAAGSRVLLNSPGGSVDAAMRMGGVISELQLDTEVARVSEVNGTVQRLPADCLSACTFVFMGGVRREVPSGSTLGFHGVRVGEGLDARAFNPDAATAMLYSYVQDRDVHGDVVLFARQVPPSRMCAFSRDQLERWNVVTTGSKQRLPRPPADAGKRWDQAMTQLEDQLKDPKWKPKKKKVVSVRVNCTK